VSSMKSTMTLLTLGLALLAVSCKPTTPEKKVSFTDDVKPLLEQRCVNCHHVGALLGELNLENRTLAMAARSKGPAIVPGKPAESPMYLVLTLPEGDQRAMPPTGHRIENDEVELIRRWIAEGADWPEGAAGAVRPLPPLREGVVPPRAGGL